MTWPELTSNLIRKHLPKFISTEKVHLQQINKTYDKKTKPATQQSKHCIMTAPTSQTNKVFLDQCISPEKYLPIKQDGLQKCHAMDQNKSWSAMYMILMQY